MISKSYLFPSGKRHGFSEVEDFIADMKKAGEKVDITMHLFVVYDVASPFTPMRLAFRATAAKCRCWPKKEGLQ